MAVNKYHSKVATLKLQNPQTPERIRDSEKNLDSE